MLGRSRPFGSNKTDKEMAVTLATRPIARTILGPRRRRPTAHGEVRHRRRRAALRHAESRPGTRTARSDPRRVASSPRTRSSCATSRGSATSRRCSRSSTRSASGSSGAGPTSSRCAPQRVHDGRDRPRAGRADQRLVPAGRPAARPLPPRGHAPPRRRRDRPPPPGPPPRRVPRDGRRRRLRWRDRAHAPRTGCARPTCSWTSPR